MKSKLQIRWQLFKLMGVVASRELLTPVSLLQTGKQHQAGHLVNTVRLLLVFLQKGLSKELQLNDIFKEGPKRPYCHKPEVLPQFLL